MDEVPTSRPQQSGEQQAQSAGSRGERQLVELANPPGVCPPQASYSHVARVGNTLYISGQVPFDLEGNLVGRGDAEAQAMQCFRNILAIVEHYGGSARNVVKLTTLITNWGFRAPVAAARERVFSPPYPGNTLAVISSLASADWLVEIEAIAVLDD
jgi:enamine deaminase RidA (YjgF/YER057c/UK114 family)